MYFLVNIAKFLRTAFVQNTSGGFFRNTLILTHFMSLLHTPLPLPPGHQKTRGLFVVSRDMKDTSCIKSVNQTVYVSMYSNYISLKISKIFVNYTKMNVHYHFSVAAILKNLLLSFENPYKKWVSLLVLMQLVNYLLVNSHPLKALILVAYL